MTNRIRKFYEQETLHGYLRTHKPKEFKSIPFYNVPDDSVCWFALGCDHYAKQVAPHFIVYYPFKSHDPIGFKVMCVTPICRLWQKGFQPVESWPIVTLDQLLTAAALYDPVERTLAVTTSEFSDFMDRGKNRRNFHRIDELIRILESTDPTPVIQLPELT